MSISQQPVEGNCLHWS